MWVQRLTQRIRQAVHPLLIEDNLYGVSEVADSFLSDNGRTLWIEFEPDGASSLKSANWGVPSIQQVATLADAMWLHKELLHIGATPVVFLTRAENSINEIGGALAALSGSHKIVISGSIHSLDLLLEAHPDCELINKEQLYVVEEDIVDKFGLRETKEKVTGFQQLAGGRTYEELCVSANEKVGLHMPQRRTPRLYNSVSACLCKDNANLVQLLARNRHWKRSLDVALATDSTELFNVIDLVGEDALLHSELESFRRKLLALPNDIKNSAEVLYWLLIAEHHLRLDTGLDKSVMEFLKNNDCARLRALLSTLGKARATSVQELTDTEADDPMLRIYIAHMQSFGEMNSDAVSRLRRLVDNLRSSGREYRQLQSMTILANSLILRGKISEAVHWALEARAFALELNLNEYEIAIATGTASYALMMSGDWQRAAELLNQVPNPEKFAGLPFAEGLLSTIADHFAAAGFHRTALSWYEIVVEHYSGPSADIVMPDIAMMLVRLGKPHDALVRVMSRLADLEETEVARPWLILAHAIALMPTNALASESKFRELLDGGIELPVLFKIRARMLVALQLFKVGMKEGALEMLDPIGDELQELGDTGWNLLTGADVDSLELQYRWLQFTTPVEVQFLGGTGKWRYRNSNSETTSSARLKELLCVLTFFPSGIKADHLTELLGWGALGENTVRRHIHRLRSYVPILGRPYRLGVRVKADYLFLIQAIEDGDVGSALHLYTGSLLSDSDAPYIRDQRSLIEGQLRTLILNRGTSEQVADLALKIGDDLDLLEYARTLFDSTSKLRIQLEARITAVKFAWAADD